MLCGCAIHFLGVWLVGGAFVPEGPSKKLAPMLCSLDLRHLSLYTREGLMTTFFQVPLHPHSSALQRHFADISIFEQARDVK